MSYINNTLQSYSVSNFALDRASLYSVPGNMIANAHFCILYGCNREINELIAILRAQI